MEPGKYYYIEDKALGMHWIILIHSIEEENVMLRGDFIRIESDDKFYYSNDLLCVLGREVREATNFEKVMLVQTIASATNVLEKSPIAIGDMVIVNLGSPIGRENSFYGHYHGDVGTVVSIRYSGTIPIYQVRVEGRKNLGIASQNVTEYLRNQLILVNKQKAVTQKEPDEWAILDKPEEDFSCLNDL